MIININILVLQHIYKGYLLAINFKNNLNNKINIKKKNLNKKINIKKKNFNYKINIKFK